MGHAGSDYEPAYRRPEEIAADFERDPVLRTAKLLIDGGRADTRRRCSTATRPNAPNVIELAERGRRTLPSSTAPQAVMKPLRTAWTKPSPRRRVTDRVGRVRRDGHADDAWRSPINRALHDILDRYPEAMIFGEDVARKGGVYGVTRGLLSKTVRRGCSTRCSTSSPSSVSRSAPGCRDCCRSPRSSTSPTFTTPRTRSAARRDAAVLLQPAVPQPDGGAGCRLRIPEGFRRALPQRQLHRRDPRHPRRRHRLTRAARRRRRDAARLRRRGEGGGNGLRLPRTDRAVPHAGSARRRRRRLARAVSGRRACRSAAPAPTATART